MSRPARTTSTTSAIELAEAVRSTCVATATAAYEDAGLQGLCAEGRWEAAVGAVEGLDLAAVLETLGVSSAPPAG